MLAIKTNGGLSDLDAELWQFTMDARCTPEGSAD
jgi:hypothetical protein